MSSISKAAQLGGRLLKIAATNPARLSHVLGTALWACEEVADRAHDLLRFRQVTVADLLPPEGPPLRIELALFPKTHASVSPLEFTCLVLLLKQARARSVFEFGTYQGVSITQLALNLPPESRIFTLDLPEETASTRFAIADAEDAVIAKEKGKGALVPAELRPRIQFLRQDSAAFDEAPHAGAMDFVFVDGAHNDDYVRNDSEKGWRMLRRGGIIAWHDCRSQDPAVVRYLLESSFQPALISGTTLAFAVKP
jgi:predicted O-methyltransferase YrrM